MSVRFEYSRKYPRIPHSPHPKPVSFRTFDTPVSRQDLCLSTMDDVSAGPRATEGPSPWHRRRVVGRESVGCFMIRCIFRAYGSGKWRRGTLFYTDPCVLFPERLWLRNALAGFVDFLKTVSTGHRCLFVVRSRGKLSAIANSVSIRTTRSHPSSGSPWSTLLTFEGCLFLGQLSTEAAATRWRSWA